MAKFFCSLRSRGTRVWASISGLCNAWPAVLSNVARAWVKVDKELHCIYSGCKREINSYYSRDQIKAHPLTRTYTWRLPVQRREPNPLFCAQTMNTPRLFEKFEIDKSHVSKKRGRGRDSELGKHNFKLLRTTNFSVAQQNDFVICLICLKNSHCGRNTILLGII